jgi:DNA-binding CsgD family transcriptional regulator
VVGSVPWSAHICLFYQTKDDLLDAVLAYLSAGWSNNEACLWVVSAPIDMSDAERALARTLPDLQSRMAVGGIEIFDAHAWYLRGNGFNSAKVVEAWDGRLERALSNGYDGLRVAANTFWAGEKNWRTFVDYEGNVDSWLANKRMIALCTYSLDRCGASGILDVAGVHNCALARRSGEWIFLESANGGCAQHGLEPRLANGGAIRILTTREQAVLGYLTRGISGKEAGRALGISHRTVEFHRTNIMRKLGARNLVDLVRIVAEGNH